METTKKDLEYYRKNAEEDYLTTPISVLRYITEMEQALRIHDVSGSSIRIPNHCLKFEGLDNLSIVSENPIPLSDLFELHLKLENYLKTRPETIVNNDGLIVGFKNYH